MKLPLESISLDSVDLIQDPRFKVYPKQLHDTIGRIVLPRQLSVLHGIERFPLTALAHQVVVSAAKAGLRAFYIDSGGSNYSASLTRSYCGEEKRDDIISRISVGLVLSLDDLDMLMDNISIHDEIGVIVIDSLTGLLNLTTPPGTKGRQRKLYKTLEKLREMVNNTEAHLLMTDHSSIDWHTGVAKPMGGNVIAHAVDSVVRVNALDIEKDAIRIQVERSSITPPPGGVVIKVNHHSIKSLKAS